MIRVNNLKLPVGYKEADLQKALGKALHTDAAWLDEVKLLRQAVDARKKNDVHCVVSVAVNVRAEQDYLCYKNVEQYQPKEYRFPHTNVHMKERPVVVGSGPAGLFCALCLAQAGAKPLLIERGKDVDARQRDVTDFFRTGRLDTQSNVQFGEGGAGTFSDGKLMTGTKDIRQRFVLEQYVQAGAPEDILYLAKPHMGTDKLQIVAKNMRQKLQELGGEILFSAQMTDIAIENGSVAGVIVNGDRQVKTSRVILAIGHSARDTFELLHQKGIALAPKSFAVGVRIEHLQHEIDMAQYGSVADYKNLPVSDYKLAYHAKDGRSAFTFCVCPGGSVVAAASERDMTVANGMSEYARSGQNCNGALLVGVDPQDFGEGPLAGISFQRELEQKAYELGGGGYIAPAQLVGDFLRGRVSAQSGSIQPTYRPGVRFADLSDCLPDYVVQTLREALPAFGRRIKGFDAEQAVLTAVESRSSSPVRILRDETYQSNIKGIFPCGEGAGYAGGIMSAAVDGVKCAEHVLG